ncbi:hypothetical protein E0L36_18945 [Streptomyces sp. AJS327]|nr:hypothetical protein [Streptomyces sp. AJS327]
MGGLLGGGGARGDGEPAGGHGQRAGGGGELPGGRGAVAHVRPQPLQPEHLAFLLKEVHTMMRTFLPSV